MKFNLLILLAIFSFFLFSCDSGLKFDNPLENNPDANNQGNSDAEMQDEDSNEQTDTDPTDNESEDTDPGNPDTTPEQPDNGDSEPDDTDSDDSDSAPDNGDSEPDDTDTENDADKDTSDSTDDTDSDNPDTSDSGNDNDADSEPTDLCVPNPCLGIENSTEICTVVGNIHTCECKPNYYWDGSVECINPCNEDSCSGEHMISDSCTPTGASSYTCGCESGYYWWATETSCTDKRPLTLGNICTGQNKCYPNDKHETITCPSSSSTDFYGQDAQYATQSKCTPQSFTVQTISSQKVVLDNNTGLMWQQTISSSTYTWGNAVSDCSSLTYAGYSDWRLPTPQELLTIVDNSRYNPAIDTTYFQGTPSEYFWCAPTYVRNTDYAWGVHFGRGYVGSKIKTFNSYVRCVRGTTLPTSSFNSSTVNGDVIVTDTETGLVWQKSYIEDKTWQQALSYCENLTYAGYSDWRLPNKNELSSLVNYAKDTPASDFPDMPSKDWLTAFWSSSTYVSDVDYAWHGSFLYGTMGNYLKTRTRNVRCVRNVE